ncbi:MAG: acyl-CoA dehydrogenase [Alteromonadaceae bacterium]|nr:acyl-CoA dehydrogenase [Alteromonadaceae bacterium]
MLFWLMIVALVVTLFMVKSLRQQWVTGPVFKWFKNVLPPLTQTEREAMEAGSVWVEGDLFSGKPDWERLYSMALPQLTAEEQSFIDNEVNELMSMIDDFKVVHADKDFSPEAWQFMREKGFFAMIIPKAYGGKAFSALANSTIVSKIASRSVSAGVTVMVPNSLGPGELLSHYGTEEQKNYWLPRLAKGTDIPCFALTGPEAGSDAGSIPDTGVVTLGEYEGKETLGIRLNWDKRYITLAPVATVLGLAFKLFDPEGLLGDKKNIGITCALIPTDHPGVKVGQRHLPLEQAFMNGTTRGEDVFIPLDWIIGGADYAGKGWRMLMECLSAGRGISLPALSTGNAQLSAQTTAIYSAIRQQFGCSLYEFEGVQEGLAQLTANAYQVEAVRHLTAGAIDLGQKPAVVTAIAKYHMTELARQSINIAMDISGGKGIQMGPNNYLASLYMAMPVSITVEGANILTRNLMIFGQGATRCHPYVFDEMVAAAEPDFDSGLAKFEPLLGKHVRFALGNAFAAFGHGLTGARFAHAPKSDANKHHTQQIQRMSNALALCADVAMLMLGGELKRREMLSARLGDVLSELYLASAVLKHFYSRGAKHDEQATVDYLIAQSLYRCEVALKGFCRHISNPLVGVLLKRLLFPWGSSYSPPKDTLKTELALRLCQDKTFRDSITPMCYVGQNDNDPVAILNQAMTAIDELAPLVKKVKAAQHAHTLPRKGSIFQLRDAALAADVISAQQASQIDRADTLRKQVINVDEFDFELTKAI